MILIFLHLITLKMHSFIYIREHIGYGDLVKLGVTNNIPDRNNTYLTGEVDRGIFTNVYQIPRKNSFFIEKYLQNKFEMYHVQRTGGTEFYSKCIIQLVDPALSNLNFEYKKLSDEDISALTREKRKYKINTKKLIQQLKSINPRKYQLNIIDKSVTHFQENSKGILVLSCGSGKTLISLWIAQRLKCKKILIGVPNLNLLDQWEKEIGKVFEYPVLKVSKDCNLLKLENFMKNNNNFVIITSYMSCMKLLSYNFDIKILDECHHLTTENLNIESDERKFAQMHIINSTYQLGLTATMKLMSPENIGNDNEIYFGKVIHKISTYEAIEKNIICDYVINALIAEEQQIIDILKIIRIVDDKKGLFLAAYSALKSLYENNTNHILIYCNTNENAIFVKILIKKMLEKCIFKISDFYANTFFGEDSTLKRKEILDNFISSKKGIICCVFCLGEGWDLPLLDGVVFAENMSSSIRIIQAALRPCRKNNLGKIAKIIIPVLYEKNLLTNEENPDFKKIRQILYQIGLDDVSIMEKIHISIIEKYISTGTKSQNGISTGEFEEEIKENLQLGIIERINSKLSYEKVKAIISGKCENLKDYLNLCKDDYRLPKNPIQYFGNEFINWIDFLSISNKYLDLQNCKKEIQRIFKENPEIKKLNYFEICQILKQINNNFPPPEFWVDFYKVNKIEEIIGNLSIIKRRKKFKFHNK